MTEESYFERKMRQDREANSTIQRRRTMSRDEKRIGAVAKVAREIKKSAHQSGKDMSYSDAHAQAVQVAEKTFGRSDG